MKRITTPEARRYVEQRIPFKNSNGSCYGCWLSYTFSHDGAPEERQFVVSSYGRHFPMFIYHEPSGQWFGNKDKWSRTTSKHKGYTQPHGVQIEWRDNATMREIANNGLAGAVRKQFRGAVS